MLAYAVLMSLRPISRLTIQRQAASFLIRKPVNSVMLTELKMSLLFTYIVRGEG